MHAWDAMRVTARGFNAGVDADRLLANVDGHRVCSPIHFATFREQLQAPLDDAHRIEVTGGAGGTQGTRTR